jgi:hypothetical protein
MDLNEKTELNTRYVQRNYITPEEEKSNSANSPALRTPAKDIKLHLMSTEKTKPRFSEQRSHLPAPRAYEDESDFNRYSERISGDSRSEPSSSPRVIAEHDFNKLGKAGAHRNYIMFYKHHYKKLAKKHPRWVSMKISQIIKLLWKREQLYVKNLFSSSKKIRKAPKLLSRKVSGYLVFKMKMKREGAVTEEVRQGWKHLPYDSRRIYELEGEPQTAANSMSRSIRFSPSDFAITNSRSLDFLNRRIA